MRFGRPLVQCPKCNHRLSLWGVHCMNCHEIIAGPFDRCRYCDLPPEQFEFLEVFIRCRGVIRQMEKELGISYPTVRARLDELLRALGFEGEPAEGETVRSVLGRVEAGELTAEEAIGRIRLLKGGR